MADFNTFNDTDSPENTNIADATDPTKKAKVSIYGDVGANDVVDSGTSIQAQLTVGTSAVEVKVGVSRLDNRKLVTLDNTSNVVIYWGFTNAITTSTYAGRIFKDQQARWSVGPNQAIFLIAGSAGNTVRISEGA